MFPGASAEATDASYALLGGPLDATTTHRPGARFGPRAIRHAAEQLEDYDRVADRRFSDLGVHDAGDVAAWPEVPSYLEYLASTVRGHVLEGRVPLVLGGEHTVTLAAVEATEPRAAVVLDAHLDLRDEHGRLRRSHATVTRRVLELVDEVVVIGARSGSEEGWALVDAGDVVAVSPSAVEGWTPDVAGPLHLSVDIDAVDPAYAPATGTPHPFGLDPRTVRDLVAELAPRAVGFDVVEVTGDDGGTATLAATLIRRFAFAHAEG